MAAAMALAVLWPVMFLVALATGVLMGRPALFRQVRPGKDRKPFVLYKFRSMTNGRAKDGSLLSDGRRRVFRPVGPACLENA